MSLFKSLVFLMALAAPVMPPCAAQTPVPAPAKAVPRNVSPAEFDALRQGTNAVVLDVRTPAEFADGHLANAVLLDFNAPDFGERLAQLDKSKFYLVHCAVGGRSSRTCVKMMALGITNVVNLKGGIEAWREAGKLVEK